MEGRASPRKPRVAMVSRSSAVRSFEVAWRSKASSASSRTMPQPSSVIWMSLLPPASTSMRMRVAPASSEFSSSSLTTEAGRSTTSPAAIWLATFGKDVDAAHGVVGRQSSVVGENMLPRPVLASLASLSDDNCAGKAWSGKLERIA